MDKPSSQKRSSRRKVKASQNKLDFKEFITMGANEYIAEALKGFLEKLMQEEAEHLSGANYSRKQGQQPVRWGSENGIARVNGHNTQVVRPRLRIQRGLGKSEELTLETYKVMNRKDLIDGPLLACILAGVSARNYEKIVTRGLRSKGLKKSTVSRKAIAATKPIMDAFLNRDLSHIKCVALFLDGVQVAGRQAVACIAVDSVGRKHALGIQFGGTENEIVCRDLLRDLIRRGLDAQGKYLFVIDGSKALAAAIRCAFGQETAIQRCQEHKIRDIQAYLPIGVRQQFRHKLQNAYAQKTEKMASKMLMKIRGELSLISGKAVQSLTEGLYETLTIHRLQVTGDLRKSLKTTNIIESAFSAVRRYLGRVSNFQNEEQRDRWLIRSLVEAEKNFRTLPGNRQLAELRQKLKNYKAETVIGQ